MSILNSKDILTLNSIYVRGLLSCSKFQHRVEVKPKFGGKIVSFDKNRGCAIESFTVPSAQHLSPNQLLYRPVTCPVGNVGDQLYVKESWSFRPATKGQTKGINLKYSADDTVIFVPEKNFPAGWTPPSANNGSHLAPATLPKQFCRFVVKIVNIRAERLMEISREDALKEGVEMQRFNHLLRYKNYTKDKPTQPMSSLCPIESYLSLCEHLKGASFIKRNPFVWVISFDFEEILSCTK